MAVVVVTVDTTDYAALIAYVAERLPAFMVPRYMERAPAIPKTESGKLKKYPLRARGIGAGTWDRQSPQGN